VRDALQSSAEVSSDAVDTMLTTVGLSWGRRFGWFDGLALNSVDERYGWTPKLDSVTPENYKAAAKERLGVFMKVCVCMCVCVCVC
jgi:hypothetical protein